MAHGQSILLGNEEQKEGPTFYFTVKSIPCFISWGFGVRLLKVFLSALNAVINPLNGILLEMRGRKKPQRY